jgi:hypothetical protein
MSDINYSFNVALSKPPLVQNFAASGVTADMAATGLFSVTPTLGTAVTQISTATLASVGLCLARNLSTSTSTSTTVSFGRYIPAATALYETVTLRPGEAALLRLSAGSYAAKAAAEGTPLLLQILEG